MSMACHVRTPSPNPNPNPNPKARRLLGEIVRGVINEGYTLRATSRSHHHDPNCATFFFSPAPREEKALSSIDVEEWVCVMPSQGDSLLVFAVPPSSFGSMAHDVQAMMDDVIARSWSRGVQASAHTPDGLNYKLKGNWLYPQGEDTVASRALVAALLDGFRQLRFDVVASPLVNTTQAATELFLRRNALPTPPSTGLRVGMSFNRQDRLRLVNAPQQLVDVVRQILQEVGRLQDENVYGDSIEFKCVGYPFGDTYHEASVRVREIVRLILCAFASLGWEHELVFDNSRKVSSSAVEVKQKVPSFLLTFRTGYAMNVCAHRTLAYLDA